MRSPYVYQVDRIADFDEVPIAIGVDHDLVTIGVGGSAVRILCRLDADQREQFERAYHQACQEADSYEEPE